MSKILVIEDNVNILEEVLIWLEIEGYKAIGATNGIVGVQLALKEQPDLILCDIMMPEKDGYRVLLELRANKTTALTPFIFITAKQEKSDIRHGMELGADDYITKPFSREDFLGTVRSRLGRRELYVQHSQQQLTMLRDNLFRNLPHELRTPLVGILGISELLTQDAKTLTPVEIVEYAEMLKTSGQQLYRLIENHLLYVQLEIKARSVEPSLRGGNEPKYDPVELIQETCIKIAQSQYRINDLHFELVHGNVSVRSHHLSKIISEIVDNAFKFSLAGTPVIVHSDFAGNILNMRISDCGHGMSAEEIERMGPYLQFRRDSFEQQGAGLGFAIARLLTQMYGGSLTITSIPETLTTVHIMLPIE